jgi:hypothetical protein
MLKGLSANVSSADIQAVAERLEEFKAGLTQDEQEVIARLQIEAAELADEFAVQGFGMQDSVNILDRLGIA